MNNHKLKTKGKIHDTITGYDFRVDEALRPRRAIRQKCLECVSMSSPEVRTCQIYDCTLWPFRLGRGVTHDPEGKVVEKRERSELQKEKDVQTGIRLKRDRLRVQNAQE